MSEAAPAPAPQRHLASHVFNVVVFAIGGIALLFMMEELGWARARDVLSGIGAWAIAIVALDVGALCCEAAAIRSFMRPEARMVSYVRVLAAQASGRAINILTPGGALGEATKIAMLVTHAPRARVVSSIVLYNLASFYLSVAIVIAGVPLTLALADIPGKLRVVVWVSLAILVPLVILLGIVIHRGILRTVFDSARGMRLLSGPRAQALKERLAEIDGHLKELARGWSPGTRDGLVFVCASRLCGWTSLALLLHAMGVEITATLLIGVFSVGVLISWAAAIVPLGLGIADGGNYALYRALGATGADGVFMTLANRARSLTLALLGITAMAVAHTLTRVMVSGRLRRFRRERARAAAAAERP